MSMGYGQRRGTSRAKPGIYGQTYGMVGVAAYGPGTPQVSRFVPIATGHGSNRNGAVVTLGGLRTATASPFAGVAQIPYGAAPTQGGVQIAGGTASAGVGLTTTLIGAAAAGSTIPVAGWIVAGGLIVTAGVIVLVDTLRRKGVAAARQEAAAMGYPQDFVNEYGRMAVSKLTTVQKRKKTLERKVKAEQKDVSKAKARLDKKPDDKSRKQAYERQKKQMQADVDRLNAASVVIGLKTVAPEEPVIAGQQQTAPITVEERGPVGDAVAGISSMAGGGVAAVAVGAAALGLGYLVVSRLGRGKRAA